MKTLIYTFSVLTLIVNISFAQLNTENLFNAPFISSKNTQQSMQSIMQNSDKDIVFIENLGQIRDTKGRKRPDVLFLTRSQGVDMYITSSGITYVFRKTEGDINAKDKSTDIKKRLYRLEMEFTGMNKNIKIRKEFAVEQQYNYYTPEYPNGISPKAYKKITIEDIYEGIDLVYYEKDGKMKYDFIVKAGADAGKIKMMYKGAGSVYIDKDGSVIVTTPMGEIREEKPYTYSRNSGKEIESGYEVKDNLVQFYIAEYDKSEAIIIDPFRLWATYYGGSAWDEGLNICTDNTGNLYVTGRTKSTNFPTQTLTGAYNQNTLGGNDDVFILKFNSSGARMWATYYGGSSNERGYSICTDNSGALYVTGFTQSTNFPTQTLAGAYNQTTLGGNDDVFILKFNSSGARLWATYYGGNNEEYGYNICTDNTGDLYVTGRTKSTNFPTQTLTGAYNQTYGGGGDVFILKFNSSGARLWATYYGGSVGEIGRSICTDNSGNLYVTGYTLSSNFPTQTLSGAYNQTYGGGNKTDVFILKFNSSGARLWATYYGGSGTDQGWSSCTDNSGNLYVTGGVFVSTNFPTQTLSGAYNQTYGGWYDAFILKFNSSGARLWATYYGGSNNDRGHSICTDNSNNLYVTGNTESTNFPTQTLAGAYNQIAVGGSRDAFILKFNSSGARLWATYYGGQNIEYGTGICTDNSDNLYVTGWTWSTDFPTQTLTGAYNQTTYGGGTYDAFILRFGTLPIVTTGAATNVTSSSAEVNGIVNPNDLETTAYFEWGTDNTLSTFSTTTSQSIGSGTTNVPVSEVLSGLSDNTTYYYRIVGENSSGTVRGEIKSFAQVSIANGDVSGLIAAINAANSNPGFDVITLAPGGTYTLTAVNNTYYYFGPSGLPWITSQITINGNGATIQRSGVASTPDFRIFMITGGELTLNQVTIRGGSAVQGEPGYTGGGGGIRNNNGILLLVNSTVTGNKGYDGGGGGIFNSWGTLTVINSTISYNTGYGGRTGGGILNMSSGGYIGKTTIINSTIFENRADGSVGFQGRGDAIADSYSPPGSIVLKNSILGSPTNGLGSDFYVGPGVVTSLGHNIVSDASGGLTGIGDLNSTDPLLGPLAYNGGPTQTHAPLLGSPVIDAVPLAFCTDANGNPITTDQRNVCPASILGL